MGLVQIGEKSLDRGERLEDAGKDRDALRAYERAVWAFSAYASLTGKPAILYEDAAQNVERLKRKMMIHSQ